MLRTILFTIVISFVTAFVAKRFLPDRYPKLAITFIAYVGMAFIFAAIYLRLYNIDHSMFLFSSDLVKERKAEIIQRRDAETNDKLRTTREKREQARQRLDALKQLLTVLQKWQGPVEVDSRVPPGPNADWFIFKTHDYECSFELRYRWQQEANGSWFSNESLHINPRGQENLWSEWQEDITLELPPGSRFEDFIWEIPHTSNIFLHMVSPLVPAASDQLNGLNSKLADLEKMKKDLLMKNKSVTEEKWGFVDFLYFSVITQTTVGYGDILPNKTIVRLVVMLQLLTGLMLVGFVVTAIALKDMDGGLHPENSAKLR
jgi:Ion channel